MTSLQYRNLLVLALCCAAAAPGARAAEPAQRGFQTRTFTDGDKKTYPYVVFIPHKLDAATCPPAILFLHGAGERGDNGLDQIMVGLGPAIWKQRTTFPFVA